MFSVVTAWLSYTWLDNVEDVDFIAQELEDEDITVLRDRTALEVGKRHWNQIGKFISDPSKTDGWILYATEKSLQREGILEEIEYALNRALENRGEEYPLIAIFPGPVSKDLIPIAIRSRLYVTLTDRNWKERVIASLHGRLPDIRIPRVESYDVNKTILTDDRYMIELRPRAGTWLPFFLGIPIEEKELVDPKIAHGAPGLKSPPLSVLIGVASGQSQNGKLYTISVNQEATPTRSFYFICKKLPSRLVFGSHETQHTLTDL
jgi:hypothetical protein